MPTFHIASRLSTPSQQAQFSFEFFLPDSEQGALELRPRIVRYASTDPLFVDIACPGDAFSVRQAMRICAHSKRVAGLPAMLHIGSVALPAAEVRSLLRDARQAGVTNLLVECAELHEGSGSRSAELVRFIRAEFGDAFCLGVTGFPPGGNSESGSYADDLRLLRAKQDAGAEFVVTRHVLDAQDFVRFRSDAAAAGVTVPIVCSVLPLHNFDNFMQLNAHCGLALPPALVAELSSLRDEPTQLRELAIRRTAQLCRELLSHGAAALHFVTMNLESSTWALLSDLGFAGPTAASRRLFPWRPSGDEGRAGEDVRPIHWSNHPESYVERTAGWGGYSGPWTGRGAARVYQPPLQELLIPPWAGTPEERRAMWGSAPTTARDVWEVFVRFIEGRVPRLPWSPAALLPETHVISDQLVQLNRAGFLTINSQPRLNAARSDDSTYGWGGTGGYVYQKAYIECFAPPTHVSALMDVCRSHTSITYHAVDAAGNAYSNCRTRVSCVCVCACGGASSGRGAVWSMLCRVCKR
jgi:methylenetetrahydrofolate reductase (NADPH)